MPGRLREPGLFFFRWLRPVQALPIRSHDPQPGRASPASTRIAVRGRVFTVGTRIPSATAVSVGVQLPKYSKSITAHWGA